MPDGDDEIVSHEKMCFSQFNPLALHLHGAEHNKKRVAIGFDLWPLMRTECIFDGELMQAKLFLYGFEHGFIGLLQTDPHKTIRFFQHFVDACDGHFCDPAAFVVFGAVDDHGSGWALVYLNLKKISLLR